MSMYNQKLVVCIKSHGKILREFQDQVLIPFGSEYTILLKNLNTVRAQVKVFIDGIDATEQVSLVINPNDSIELERFIKNGNISQGNRFKFIERTPDIEEHRGIGVEDGIVRVEYQFEQKYNLPIYTPSTHIQPVWNNPQSSILRGTSNVYGSTPRIGDIQYSNIQSMGVSTNSVNEVGITVPGSISDQKFTHSSFFTVESKKHNIILRLIGQVEDIQVEVPVTVKTKNKCITCGKVNKAVNKFCSNCGTSLTII